MHVCECVSTTNVRRPLIQRGNRHTLQPSLFLIPGIFLHISNESRRTFCADNCIPSQMSLLSIAHLGWDCCIYHDWLLIVEYALNIECSSCVISVTDNFGEILWSIVDGILRLTLPAGNEQLFVTYHFPWTRADMLAQIRTP